MTPSADRDRTAEAPARTGRAGGDLRRVLRPARPYVEVELAGGDADAAVPGLRAHLDGCPACREDYESLRAYVSGQGVRPRRLGGAKRAPRPRRYP